MIGAMLHDGFGLLDDSIRIAWIVSIVVALWMGGHSTLGNESVKGKGIRVGRLVVLIRGFPACDINGQNGRNQMKDFERQEVETPEGSVVDS